MSRLSVCMIVKDESDTIASAIRSVTGIASEILVVDTGSSDDTISVARSCGASVSEYKWSDSFADARNHVKSLAKGDWILSLDGDEVVASKDCTIITDFLASSASEDYLAVELEKRSYVNRVLHQYSLTRCTGKYKEEDGFSSYLSEPNYLLFRNSPSIEWNGAVHESICNSIESAHGRVAKLPIVVHNYGRTRNAEEKARKYPKLVKKRLEEDPGDPASWYYYGLMLDSEKEYERAQEAFQNSVSLGKTAHAVYALGLSLFRSGDSKKAEVQFVEYLRYRPKDRNAWISILACAMHRQDMDCMDYYLNQATKAGVEDLPELFKFAQYSAAKKGYHSKADTYGKLSEEKTIS